MLDWIFIVAIIGLALLYLFVRLARWLRIRRTQSAQARPSRPQGLTVDGRRVR